MDQDTNATSMADLEKKITALESRANEPFRIRLKHALGYVAKAFGYKIKTREDETIEVAAALLTQSKAIQDRLNGQISTITSSREEEKRGYDASVRLYEQQIGQLTADREALTNSLSEANGKVSDLDSRLGQSEQARADIDGRYKVLQTEYEKVVKLGEELTSKLAVAESKATELETKLAQTKHLYEQAQSDSSTKAEEIERLSGMIEENARLLSENSHVMEGLRTQIAQYKTSLSDTNTQYRSLQAEVEAGLLLKGNEAKRYKAWKDLYLTGKSEVGSIITEAGKMAKDASRYIRELFTADIGPKDGKKP
jgi:chromosome segregation ATPase